MQNYYRRGVLLEFYPMLFISDLEVNIKLLLMTFVENIMVGKIAKNKSPGWPGEKSCTAWLRQTKCILMLVLLLGNSDKSPVMWPTAAWRNTTVPAQSWTLKSQSADVILGSAARWPAVYSIGKAEPERLFMGLTATFQNIQWQNWKGYKKEPQKWLRAGENDLQGKHWRIMFSYQK